MIPYYWIQEETELILSSARAAGLHTSLWFPPGYMRDSDTWMLNHVKPHPANPYPHYKPDRDIQELVPKYLYAKADERIRLSGFQGPTSLYEGYLCPNYEDYLCITHPGETRNLSQEASYRNHEWLVMLMRARYPYAKLANWGLPQAPDRWGEFDLGGYQILGQLTELYDMGAPSAYCLHRDDDFARVQARMDWAVRWDIPLVVYMSPWERWRTVHGGDNKWYAQPRGKMQIVMDMVLATPNVVGVEIWSMVKHSYIAKGWMEASITSPEQIDQVHIRALKFLGQAVNQNGS